MAGGVLRRLFAVFALLAAALPVAAATGEGRVVAVGDLHGDAEAFEAILRASGLTAANGRWAGGAALLVQLGDITDRGPDSLKIIRRLQVLRTQAKRGGGRVVSLVGNHEAMNVIGDLRYVHPGEYAAFADGRSAGRRERAYEANRTAIEAPYRAREDTLDPARIKAAWLFETPLGKLEHRVAWSPRGEIGRWVIANPAVLRVGRTLFVHGGLSPAYAALGVEAINSRVATALAASDADPASIITAENGPLWYRGLARSELSEPELEQVLRAADADRIVVAHTPTGGVIATAYGGRVFSIDTGISHAYGGKLSYLEIVGGRAAGHLVDRPRPSGSMGEKRR